MPSAVQKVGGGKDPMVMQKHYSHASREAQNAVSADLVHLVVGEAQEDGFNTDLSKDPQIPLSDLMAALQLVAKKRRS